MRKSKFSEAQIVAMLAEGWRVNHKRVHRLYCREGLPVRMRVTRRKQHMALQRGPAPIPTGVGSGGVWTSSTMRC
jgi:putative transposase